MSANNRIVSVVDDDSGTARFFHEALRQNIDGISVFSFTDPIVAFQHFTENRENYTLVISDLRMPGLNGLELLKKVKTLNSKASTILMSAYNFEEEELYRQYMKEAVMYRSFPTPDENKSFR
jgi:DNA-binding NtrC family response regulator